MTIDEVRALALTLPRSSEGYVHGPLKFRVGRIVYLSFSRDGSTMGFAFPEDGATRSLSPTRTNFHYRASLTSDITGLTFAWPPSMPTKCATLSRTPGRLSCRNAWPRNTRPRGVTSSHLERGVVQPSHGHDDFRRRVPPSCQCCGEMWPRAKGARACRAGLRAVLILVVVPESHAGRLFDHVGLHVADVGASKRVYAGALAPLGLGITARERAGSLPTSSSSAATGQSHQDSTSPSKRRIARP